MRDKTVPGERTTPPTRGRVIKKSLGQYFVATDRGTIVCSISSRLRKELIYPEADSSSLRRSVVSVRESKLVDPVAINDEVSIAVEPDGSGMIHAILPRRNRLSRVASGRKPIEQVVVSNLDQMVPVFAAAQPEPKWGLLDRYLVTAEAAELPTVICITKLDLVAPEEIAPAIDVYQRIGYRVVLTSAVSGAGIQEMKQALKDKISVFLGKSGVGKTTLLNAIQPDLGLRVREISQKTGKGKHATSHLELFELASGGSVVDTPGMREFQPWHEGDRPLDELFPEMQPYIGSCRFGLSCTHSHEPDCAIKAAITRGEIAEYRHQSYLSMLQESEERDHLQRRR